MAKGGKAVQSDIDEKIRDEKIRDEKSRGEKVKAKLKTKRAAKPSSKRSSTKKSGVKNSSVKTKTVRKKSGGNKTATKTKQSQSSRKTNKKSQHKKPDTKSKTIKSKTQLASKLLKWYDKEQRDLPWRAKPGIVPNPYHVYLSEIMLQQTVVKTVIPYFNKFISLWPEISDLANASGEDVRRAWAGLGYYTRAENLHKCAKLICEEYEGEFPIFAEELETLPGIGPYTAAAIAAIAFDETATPVDGNIERVVARQFAVEDPLPGVKPKLKQLATTLTPPRRAGDFAQAQMDLGATICTPKNPSCLLCPISSSCEGYHLGIESTLPKRASKKPKPTRYGSAFFALREDGAVLLRQRPPGGLLGNMQEIPTSEWTENKEQAENMLKSPPLKGEWWPVPGIVKHTFTHFHLELKVYRIIPREDAEFTLFADAERCKWVNRDKLADEALPSVMRKIVQHALNN